MEEHIEKTTTTEERGSNVNRTRGRESTGSQTIAYLVYFLFGILELFLAFRFVLKLLGANPESAFVNFIYNISAVFIWPFAGIFRSGVTQGAETEAIFEPGTLIALIVYALVAWGVVKLISIFSGERQE